jgi:tetratricopeptide (TPR) repeat protein
VEVNALTSVVRATTLLELNRPAEALPLLATAIASDPEHYRSRCLMALALIQLERYKEAIERAQDAIRVAPDSDWGHRILSVALIGAKRLPEALAAAERAVALDPELAEGRIALASVLSALGRGREARVEAIRAVELAPEDADAHAAVGEAALARKNWAEAEHAFRRSLELDPEDPAVHNNLGVALIHLGRRDEAMQLFESSARSDPRDDLSRRNLGVTARRFLAGGGWTVPVVAYVVLQLARLLDLEDLGEGTAALIVLGCLLVASIGIYVYRRTRERELSPAALAVVRDDRRRMRRRPWTWEPSGLLPLPLWLLFAPPPQVIAALGGLVLVLLVANYGLYDGGDWAVAGVVALITVFFVLRARDLPRAD